MQILFQIDYMILYDIDGNASKLMFTLEYKHRSWFHICLRYDNLNSQFSFFYNGNFIGKVKTPAKYRVKGFPQYTNQFLLFGQEPDKFKGSFDPYQVLQGKISRFNWWNYPVNDSQIYSFAKERHHMKYAKLNSIRRARGGVLDLHP